jgi:hypothetical protein
MQKKIVVYQPDGSVDFQLFDDESPCYEDDFDVACDVANLGLLCDMMGGGLTAMEADLSQPLDASMRAVLSSLAQELQHTLDDCQLAMRAFYNDLTSGRAHAPPQLLQLPDLDAPSRRQAYEDPGQWVRAWQQAAGPMLTSVLIALEADLACGRCRTHSYQKTVEFGLAAVERVLICGAAFVKVVESIAVSAYGRRAEHLQKAEHEEVVKALHAAKKGDKEGDAEAEEAALLKQLKAELHSEAAGVRPSPPRRATGSEA